MKKVLIAHVPYQYRGGEDIHVSALQKAYTHIGISSVFLPEDRSAPDHLLKHSLKSLIAIENFKDLDQFYEKHRPDFIHLHNAFPVLGPRFLKWVISRKIPLLMTIHNHRFFCTNGLALRDGRICRDCFSSSLAWRPVLHNCNGEWFRTLYHSFAMTEIKYLNLLLRAVKFFIAPSPYIQDELIRWGVPEERVTHILNPIVPPAQQTSGDLKKENSIKIDVLYASRLSVEKGLDSLLAVVQKQPQICFAIVGDGPLCPQVQKIANQQKNLTYYGPLSQDEVWKLIAVSKTGVLPSICNEILPTFVLELFYNGKPCVIARQSSTEWLGLPPFPGHLFTAGDSEEMTKSIFIALNDQPKNNCFSANIRNKLCFDRFCDELEKITRKIEGVVQ